MDSSGDSINILIVDDHPTFRFGLRKLLESEPDMRIAGETGDAAEALRLARELKPHIVLLDLMLPRHSGLDILGDLVTVEARPRIIVLTAAIEKAEMVQALRLGARGIVLKEAATGLIVESIRSVMRGQYWVGREHVTDIVQLLNRLLPRTGTGNARPNFGLSPREMEIVAAIVAGYSNKEIAHKFSLSEQTVKHHITHIFDKLGVSNRMELTLFSVSHHLVDQL